MSTRAELVSIHPLSAELLASATCCSNLARRAFVSVEVAGTATGVEGGGAVCPSNGCEKKRRSKTRFNLPTSRFPMKSQFAPAAKSVRTQYNTRLTLPSAAASRKLKLFIGPIRICYASRPVTPRFLFTEYRPRLTICDGSTMQVLAY